MKCPNCNAENLDSAKFCKHCGEKILPSQGQVSQIVGAKAFLSRRNITIMLLLGTVFLTLLIVLGILIFVAGNKKIKEKSATDNAVPAYKQQVPSGNNMVEKDGSSHDNPDRLASSKARSAKALASLSSAIPSMISCGGNAGGVRPPASGSDICSLASSYGTWPLKVGDLSSYNFDSSTSDNANCPSGVSGNCLNKSSWFVSLTSGSSDDNKRICCNSTINSCEILNTATTACDASMPSY